MSKIESNTKGQAMLDRTKLVLAGMSIALSVQLSQPVAAAVPVGKVVQTSQTRSSEAAEKALNEGLKLYQQGTAQAKRSAIVQFEQALKLFREAGDRSQEVLTLNNIGAVYKDLGEQQKALKYYNQSLPLSRAIGDRSKEATTLNNIGAVYS
ncbi:tetratricopeptide repeat protein, partial [Microcoleus sp. herbarium14]|uniref:tetratricopeptide repeat protein n=1 Tax=Microcoleus sp. herbarium14 TaxID=3055439 RepID=UPI002FD02A13